MLTAKQRLSETLKGNKVDRPPCICPGGMMNMIIEEIMDITSSYWPEAHTNAQLMANLTKGLYENGGFENLGVPFCMTIEAEAMGAPVFLGTKNTEPRVTDYPMNSIDEWKKLKDLDITEGRAKVVLEAIQLLENEEIPVIGNLTGPISLATSLIEPTTYYKALRKKPKEVHEFMEFITRNLIAFGKAQLKAGADVLAISDPSGTGEILGPKMFKEFAIPYLNKIVDELNDFAKSGTIIHICGRLKGIYKELNDLHSDAISFDSITSIRQVIEHVDNKVIMGNVSTFAVEKNTPTSVRASSKNCIRQGVNILSPACGIGTKTSLENIQQMVLAAKESFQS